jgi:hypothetical protein
MIKHMLIVLACAFALQGFSADVKTVEVFWMSVEDGEGWVRYYETEDERNQALVTAALSKPVTCGTSRVHAEVPDLIFRQRTKFLLDVAEKVEPKAEAEPKVEPKAEPKQRVRYRKPKVQQEEWKPSLWWKTQYFGGGVRHSLSNAWDSAMKPKSYGGGQNGGR